MLVTCWINNYELEDSLAKKKEKIWKWNFLREPKEDWISLDGEGEERLFIGV